MFTNLLKQPNNDKVAIVVVGYNRLAPVQRLLKSLEDASYPSDDIPLLISIDCGGNEQLNEYVKNYQWPHGEKYVNLENKRLGLVKHIFQCGDLTKFFKAIILLEDDLFVAPYFYNYVLQALDHYGQEEEVCEIALYCNEMNGFVNIPSVKMYNGADVMLVQSCCTWGECFNARMWNGFLNWRDNVCTEDIIQNVDMPPKIKTWNRAWSRFFNAYMYHTNKMAIFPYISLVTNFGDYGEHGGGVNPSYTQVVLQQGDFLYRMPPIKDLISYDGSFNNLMVYKWLKMSKSDLCVDLFGLRTKCKQKFLLSTLKLPFKIINSYGLKMRPIEMNIFHNIEGEGIYLYDTSLVGKGNGKYSARLSQYYLHGLNRNLIISYIFSYLKRFFLFYNKK